MPCCTPTQIIDELQSPDIVSQPTRPSEWMVTMATSCAQKLQKVPHRDLEECFKDFENTVPNTQVLHSWLTLGSKSLRTLSRGPKEDQLAPGLKSLGTLPHEHKDVWLAIGSKSPRTLSYGPKDVWQGHALSGTLPWQCWVCRGTLRGKYARTGEKVSWPRVLFWAIFITNI